MGTKTRSSGSKTTCTLCGKPLSPEEIRIKVTAHFPCICEAAFGTPEPVCNHCGGREKCKPGCDALDAIF